MTTYAHQRKCPLPETLRFTYISILVTLFAVICSCTALEVSRTSIESQPNSITRVRYTGRFRYLDKACIKKQEETESSWTLCPLDQVEQVKILISIIPIFSCTLFFNIILAQLQTFSVSEGSAMNNK
ncbi:Major facilitator superfamily domain, general substrate transporter [Artemisia annua]|uniref:Major facilitator superfamily domain, general substrate transporter n=1 Tax=Artemisia annua TaxID=35608 RepID=A0A2U1NKB2_ARTAN|nr:Major facilitator superfamily domain, general substrate transporter [Artemisia annua]